MNIVIDFLSSKWSNFVPHVGLKALVSMPPVKDVYPFGGIEI